MGFSRGNTLQDFRKLAVWQKSHQMTLDIYRVTAAFPPEETYGLTSQIRRAMSSVPTNIAEGCGRATSKDFARFLHIANGSANEVEYQLILARDLDYISPTTYKKLNDEINQIERMLTGLIKSLRK